MAWEVVRCSYTACAPVSERYKECWWQVGKAQEELRLSNVWVGSLAAEASSS